MMRLYKLTKDVALPKKDARRRGGFLRDGLIPEGTKFVSSLDYKDNPEDRDMWSIKVDNDNSYNMYHYFVPSQPFEDDMHHLGFKLMAAAEEVTEGFRAKFMAAFSDDPWESNFSARNALEKLFELGVVTEKDLAVAHAEIQKDYGE